MKYTRMMNCWTNKFIYVLFLFLFLVQLCPAHIGYAGSLKKDVLAEGSCAIVGMSAEQSQLIALQRARANAIEQAAGVRVISSSIVTNNQTLVDIIKTYSKGFIVKEEIEWLPLGQYQKNSSTAPIPEYRLKIIADVHIPQKLGKSLGLTSELNHKKFRDGEIAKLKISTQRKSKIAIFNITADDQVVMLYPNQYDSYKPIKKGGTMIFPGEKSAVEMVARTLPNHKQDAEALFVVGVEASIDLEFQEIFDPLIPYSFSTFFYKYADIADICEENIIPYSVEVDKM